MKPCALGANCSAGPSTRMSTLTITLVVLVCVIAFGVLKKGELQGAGSRRLSRSIWHKSYRVPCYQNQPTKVCRVLRGTGKRIVIFDPSPQIDESPECLRFHDILRSD